MADVTGKTASEIVMQAVAGADNDALVAAADYTLLHALMAAEEAVEAYDGVLARQQAAGEMFRFDYSVVREGIAATADLRFWYEVVGSSSRSTDQLQITKAGLDKVVKERAQRVLLGWDGHRSTSALANGIADVENEINIGIVRMYGGDLTIGEAVR